ncbi:MAG: hypothetical protein HYU69_03215 [Bacteroidetes bacterium]|nr:hypothetical protein [Bacteroidota bacterium]
MKTPSDELFQLIKSLTSQEKRCFKLNFDIKKPKSNFITLFDAIDSMGAYSESELIKKLKKTGGIKNLKQVKSQLYDKIVVAISIYANDSSVKRKIQNLIHYSELLLEKSLYRSSIHYLLKAEALAIEHEQYPYLLSISYLKASHARHLNIKDGTAVIIDKETAAEKKYIHSIQNTIEYRNIWLGVSNIYSLYADNLKSVALLKKVKHISDLQLIKNKNLAQTYLSKNYYYDTRHLINMLTGKWNNSSFDLQNEFVKYLEQQPDLLFSRASNYITALSRVITTLNKINRSDEIEVFFNKASGFFISLPTKKKSRNLSSYFAGVILANYMDAQLILLHPEKAIDSWEKVKNEVHKEMPTTGADLVVYINLFLGYFYLSKYREALQNLNIVINFNKPNRIDIQADARLFILILHYELGNTDLLPNLTRASKNFLQKNGYYTEFANVIVVFFEKEIHSGKTKNFNSFVLLKTKLSALIKHREAKKAMEYFDYLSWIDSKLENKPFIEILRKKALQKNT